MSSVLHRQLHSKLPEAFTAWDSTIGGKFDLSSGAGVSCLGHSVWAVEAAMIQQINRLPYVHSSNWTAPAVEQFARKLLWQAGAWSDGRVLFLTTGTEAIEAACKIALQYYKMQKEEVGSIFTKSNSYHGNSLFTLEIADNPRADKFAGVIRCERIGDIPDRLVGHNVGNTIGKNPIMLVEPIGGMAAGIQPTSYDYLSQLRQACDSNNGLLICDEVLCGNWRTGHMFAWQYYADRGQTWITPDIIVCGKGLAGGYFPLSAVIVSGKVIRVIKEGSGQLWHSSTNQNHPIGCAAGLAALECYQEAAKHDIPRVALILKELVPHCIRGMRHTTAAGVGALWGIRINGPIKDAAESIRKACLNAGVAVYTGRSFVGDVILIAPPYCATLDEIANALRILREVILKNGGNG